MSESVSELDCLGPIAGYYPSAWPVECGGPRRQKVVGSPGPGIQRGERLASTVRDIGGWAVMLVQRAEGELFVQGGAGLGPGEFPPKLRTTGDSAGWLERIDPVTLETLARSPDLPSGGHLWCGAVVVHENADLYVVNGRYCHRLDADCRPVAERELPVDAPYNGLLILSDGNLVMKNLGHLPDVPCQFSILEPERLEPVGPPLVIPDACMGRFSSERTPDGEFIYCSSATELYRLRYEAGKLSIDSDWQGSYAVPGADQSDGWDTCIGSGSVWMTDMGRPPMWRGPATAPVRGFRFPTADASERDVLLPFDRPNVFNPGPPLYDPGRRILVMFDTTNAKVGAWRYAGPGQFEPLWERDDRSTVQMMLYADTGELVLEHARGFALDATDGSGQVLVVDVESGDEKGRAASGAPAIGGMFFCPGFGRDLFVASIDGSIARVYVE